MNHWCFSFNLSFCLFFFISPCVFCSSFGQLPTFRQHLSEGWSLEKPDNKTDKNIFLILNSDVVVPLGTSRHFQPCLLIKLALDTTELYSQICVYSWTQKRFSIIAQQPHFLVLEMFLVWWSMHKETNNLQEQVWLHQICQEDHYPEEVSHSEQLGNFQKPSCGCKWTPLNSILCM